MTSVEKSIDIDRPIEEVFTYASDWKYWHEWFEDVTPFRPVTEIQKGNGARYAYKASMMGMKVPIETEIHDYIINKGWNGKSTKGVPHRTHWKFEAAGKGTRFTYGLDFRMPIPLLGGILERSFLKPQWENIIESSLHNLKAKFDHV
jgi:uncharacterized membrane protein